MELVLTHTDADGVISLAFYLRHRKSSEGLEVIFTSPARLRDTICQLIINRKPLGNLKIFDLSADR